MLIINVEDNMENFINRAKLVYGEHYSYEAVVWKDNKTLVTISCPDHGAFSITPDNFIYNAGCPSCRGRHPRGYPYNAIRSPKPGRPIKTYTFNVFDVGGGFWVYVWGEAMAYPLLYSREFKGRRLMRAVDQLVNAVYTGNGDNQNTSTALIAMLKAIP